MSNTTVGSIYKKIIDAVVDVSRTDFEENGVSNDVLQILQEKWQERLSETHRASFPWDPQQAPAPVPAPAPAALKTESLAISNSARSPINQQNGNGVQIKQEPTYDQSYLNLPPTAPYSSALGQPQFAAHQRAAQLLQKQFGSQATGSIGAIQAAQMGLPGVQQRSQASQGPNGQQQSLQPNTQQRMTQSKQEGSYIKQEGNQSSLNLAQTDGAGDVADQWNAVLAERIASVDDGPTGRLAVDGMIRNHVANMAQRLEGGGLMVPLDERRKSMKHAKRTLRAQAGSSSLSSAGPVAAQFDGADDDSPVNDDDAINSDLDDSEDDELEGNIEADFQGDVILCLYDKVQRVKNKWKCTLKDGVVTVDGKDYVFHKAQGEFEW